MHGVGGVTIPAEGSWREARQQADGSPAAACLRAVYKSVFNRILNLLVPEVHVRTLADFAPPAAAAAAAEKHIMKEFSAYHVNTRERERERQRERHTQREREAGAGVGFRGLYY